MNAQEIRDSKNYKSLIAVTKKCAARMRRPGGASEISRMRQKQMRLESNIMAEFRISYIALSGMVINEVY